MRRSILSGTLIAGLTFLASGVGELQAQRPTPARNFHTGMTNGIGYAAVIPSALLGAGAYKLFGSSGVGIFADWKMTTTSLVGDSEYCPTAITECTRSWVEFNEPFHERIKDVDEWLVFNAGAVYAVTPEFALMLGGGMVDQTRLHEFLDTSENPADRVTETGRYYVDDDSASGWKPQAVLGLLIRAGSRVVFRFGYETAVSGVSVGGFFAL
jgi:hypothetical protein